MQLHDLPDEIVLHIFSHFATEDLLILGAVCNRWKRLAADDSLYREVTINENFPSYAVSNVLQMHKNSIKCLYIFGRNDLFSWASYIEECTYLESLVIVLCFGSYGDISNSISRCNRLRSININHSSCIINAPNFFHVLSKLSMKRIILRSMEPVINVSEIACLRNIEDLRLRDADVDFSSILAFCKNNATSLTTLKIITANRTECANQYVKTLFETLGECKKFNKLCLGPCLTAQLDDTCIFYLNKLKYLSTLVLHGASRVTSTGFSSLFQHLAGNLKKIALRRCPSVSDFVLRTISNNCKNLEKFVFEKCKSSQCDVEEILLLARNCGKLKTVHLFAMDISAANILHLLPIYLPSLRSLKYSNDSDPFKVPGFLAELEELMPDFDVSGLQWKFNLYVCCTRKAKTKRVKEICRPICAMDLKADVDKL